MRKEDLVAQIIEREWGKREKRVTPRFQKNRKIYEDITYFLGKFGHRVTCDPAGLVR